MGPTLAIRLLRFAGTAVLATLALFCLLLLALRFVVFPNIDKYRDELAALLTRELGQPVTIESIEAGWNGWNPRLSVGGLAVRERGQVDGPVALMLPRVDMSVAWTSIARLDLRLTELSIDRPQLSVRRDKEGRMHIAGVAFDPDAASDDTRAVDWLLQQPEIIVRDAFLVWDDQLTGAPQLVLDHVMFRLERSFGRHRFGLVGAPPAALASPLHFRGDVSTESLRDWRQAKGHFYLQFDYADVAQWRDWVPLLRQVESGQGALRVWFDFAGGRATDAVADVELAGVRTRFAAELPQLELAHLGGRLMWKASGQTREFATRKLSFVTRSEQSLAPVDFTMAVTLDPQGVITGGRMTFDELEVSPLAALAGHLPISEAFRRDLAAFALRGSVSGGVFSWDGPMDAPTRYAGSGAFFRFGIAANEALPGAAGVSGSFSFDQARGDLKLDSRDMRVVLPRVFADPLVFDTATGQVGWKRVDRAWHFTFDDIRFATPHTAGAASGTWRSRPQGPGVIDLKAQLVRADAQNLYRYLPLTLDSHVRDWLRLGLKKGIASDVRMAVAGDLADFPFADANRGKFLVTFKARDVTLDYAEHWPEMTGVEGEVKFEGTGIVVDAKQGNIGGAQVGPVRADIPDLGATYPLLTIAGDAAGSTTEFLHFIDRSPVAEWINHFTDGVQATGDGKLTLRVQIPLGKGDGVVVAGGYQFLGNHLRIPGVPALAQVNGHLAFSQSSMQSRELVAEMFGGPAKIALDNSSGPLKIVASGHADVALAKAGVDMPLLNRFTGIAAWELRADARPEFVAWTLESDMKGVGVELPDPVGKETLAVAPLRVERRPVAGKPNEDLIALDYRGDLHAVLHRQLKKDADAIVDRALVSLGPVMAGNGLPDQPGLWVRGRIGDLDLDEWLALYAKEVPSGARTATASPDAMATAPALRGVDLATGRLDVFGRVLHDLNVVATRVNDDWQLKLAGTEVEGIATWRGATPQLPNGRLQARLSRFVPPGPDVMHPVHSEVDAVARARNTWPELDIVADSLVTRQHDLGRLEIIAQPSGGDWRIAKLALANPAGRIDANGWWRVGREKQATEIDLTLTADDAGAFLDRFGYPIAVRNAPTRIVGKLAWAGAPSDFDYPTLTGNFSLKTGAGQFTKIDPGIGKLLGILSLQALPRRITLDFRDVFSEGFAFDDIAGGFNLQNGQMRTGDLKLEGPAAVVKIAGDIDLEKETQRLSVRVQPALSTSVSAGAAVLFLANPIVGAAVAAGTLLAQKMLNNPIDQMFSYEYSVSGSWSDPQVARAGTRLLSTQAPPAAGAASPAAAAAPP